jgi:hypothetical protein
MVGDQICHVHKCSKLELSKIDFKKKSVHCWAIPACSSVQHVSSHSKKMFVNIFEEWIIPQMTREPLKILILATSNSIVSPFEDIPIYPK